MHQLRPAFQWILRPAAVVSPELAEAARVAGLSERATRLLAGRGVGRPVDLAAQVVEARTGGEVAVLFVDLHRFKAVNDRFGHDFGDAVLAQLASRFCSLVRPSDTVGRLAGDEFLVLLVDATEQMACAVAQRLCDAAEEVLEVDRVPVQVGASIGVALGGADLTAAELIKRADTAMYGVKHTTGSGWALGRAASAKRGAAG